MAEIVHLKAGEKPPEGEDWLIIEVATSGKYLISTCLGSSDNAGMMGPFDSWEAALETGQERAQQWGLPVIYAKGATIA